MRGEATGRDAVFLSVIIPAFNEELRLSPYLVSIFSHLNQAAFSYEVIVVDDGSTDGTATLVEQFMEGNRMLGLIRLPENQGKGAAVRAGMLKASGALRLFADADGATPISELGKLLETMSFGADVAVASRSLPDDARIIQARMHRKLIGAVFRTLVQTLTVKGISDTQCGFKIFSSASAQAVFPLQRIAGFGFDVEVLYACQQRGYRIAEIPVNWNDVRGSKVNLVKDSCRMFLDLLRVRINDFLGYYG